MSTKNLTPQDPEYWDRKSDVIAKHPLVGEKVAIPNYENDIIITEVVAFRNLIRSEMLADHEEGRREPGRVYITKQRGSPLVNVEARTDGRNPEVLWLRRLKELAGKKTEEITGAGLVRRIAASVDNKKKFGKGGVLEYAQQELDGKSVRATTAPMRIVQNADLPVDQRDWDKDENGDGPKNAVVTAWLNSLSPVIKIRGKAHLQQLLAEVADELTVDIDELINPNKVNRYLKQSDKLRQIMEYVKQHDVEL